MNPEETFEHRILLAEGSFSDAGYYTVDFESPMELEAGERFGLLLEITTKDSTQPVAIEYQADERKGAADITDGEGYLSYDGIHFQRTETTMGCNVCLKAYTRRIP